ncbi:hypothetical protein [Ralstonia solanacearum]|uniref:hypothetical protein n=1 Tax=Ralstonia solanacearum TaxID=305 RepID=UPI002366ECD4|nr:hypothetical protein [Ralstonia solanacearum]MDD7803732.1 hypothetical protein [Ralstonia solanacearum]
MARDVEDAYEHISKPMTQEQIVQNREYLKRLLEAIASNLYHIPDRVAQTEAAQRRDDLCQEAAELMEEIHGMGRTFYKNASGGLSEADLIALIDDLKSEKAEAA